MKSTARLMLELFELSSSGSIDFTDTTMTNDLRYIARHVHDESA